MLSISNIAFKILARMWHFYYKKIIEIVFVFIAVVLNYLAQLLPHSWKKELFKKKQKKKHQCF